MAVSEHAAPSGGEAVAPPSAEQKDAEREAPRTPSWVAGLERVRAWLSHPLLILLVGAVVTGILVPSFTHRWQQAQTAQDMKTQVIANVTDAVSTAVMELDVDMSPVLHSGLPSGTVNSQAVSSSYASWTQKSAAVRSQIAAYFPSQNLPVRWDQLSSLVHNFFLLTYARDPSMRNTFVFRLKGYFVSHRIFTHVHWRDLIPYQPGSDRYQAAWNKVQSAILHVRDLVDTGIMDAPAPAF